MGMLTRRHHDPSRTVELVDELRSSGKRLSLLADDINEHVIQLGRELEKERDAQ